MSLLSSGVAPNIQPGPESPAHGVLDAAKSDLDDHVEPTKAAQVTAQRLAHLEIEARTMLKQRRTVYENERTLLERACSQLDRGTGEFDAVTLSQACPPRIPYAWNGSTTSVMICSCVWYVVLVTKCLQYPACDLGPMNPPGLGIRSNLPLDER